jgi:ElaB/YqjD/DUF883 family membrane-anchored ribosome-binding protein
VEAPNEKLTDELRTLLTAAEELLGATGAQGSEQLEELRALVRRHPLAALGIAAALGAVVGVLLARK